MINAFRSGPVLVPPFSSNTPSSPGGYIPVFFELPYNGAPLVVQMPFLATQGNTSDADLIQDLQNAVDAALGDNRGKAGDIRVGLDASNQFTFTVAVNNGSGIFTAAHDIGSDTNLTTSLALADLNGDGLQDVISGNLGFDLPHLVEQGLVRLGDFLKDTAIRITDLVNSGLVSLLDLVEKGLIDRFGFDPLTPITVGDLLDAGIARLGDLVREGLLTVMDFADLPIPASDLTASGLVTLAELTAKSLIDSAGNVSLHDLVNSGVVWLEQLIGDNLVDLGDLNVPDVTLGDLLDTKLTDVKALVQQGLARVSDLLVQQLDLRRLIESGIVQLTDLVQKNLLDFAELDPQKLDLQDLTNKFAFGRRCASTLTSAMVPSPTVWT